MRADCKIGAMQLVGLCDNCVGGEKVNALISGSRIAALALGSMLKPNREAKRIRRRTRRGSSAKVSFGGSGVRIRLEVKSFRPRPVKSSTSLVCRL